MSWMYCFQASATRVISIWFRMALTTAQFDTTAAGGAGRPNVVDSVAFLVYAVTIGLGRTH